MVSTLRSRNQQKRLIKTLFSPTTLPGTESSHVALKNDSGHTSRTQGGMRWSKKHSTSYFPGTGKRHGLVVVVVSGMALGGIRGGNVEGYIV